MFFVGYVSEYGNVVRFSNFFDTVAAAYSGSGQKEVSRVGVQLDAGYD